MEYVIIIILILIVFFTVKANQMERNYKDYNDVVKNYYEKVYYHLKDTYLTKVFLAMICQESKGFVASTRLEPRYYDKYIETNSSLKDRLLKIGVNRENFGSYGLTQILPSTAIGYVNFTSLKDFYNTDKNIEAGCKYFLSRLQYANGNIVKAIQYYNTGSNLNSEYLNAVNYWFNYLWGGKIENN